MSDKNKDLLPALQTPKEVLAKSKDLVTGDPLKAYLKEVSKYRLLTREEEKELTEKLFETGEIEIAKKLVLANLRLVVKIAMEYKKAHQNVLDLIQEGNMGLMKAVSKFDPTKGAKLSYYASWWIKSYILKFILDNFRLVKIGTTADQKKLFYNLMKEKEKLESQGINPTPKMIAKNLDVSEKSVIEMQKRIGPGSGEFSLDKKYFDESNAPSLHDIIATDDIPMDEELAHRQNLEILQGNLGAFLDGLKPRDRDIFQKRLLEEVPPSLQKIADQYGVSRERIRQIESRLKGKLKLYMSEHLG